MTEGCRTRADLGQMTRGSRSLVFNRFISHTNAVVDDTERDRPFCMGRGAAATVTLIVLRLSRG